MAVIEFTDFAFTYAGSGAEGQPVVGPVSLQVEEGAFCLLTGLTGCGKTTLLRACKPELAPRGTYQGSLEVCGTRLVDNGVPTGAMTQAFSAERIGFVMQDPDAQIVCDTVWHELAFAMENLGVEEHVMRRRVAEVAHYLGLAPWVDKSTDALSGGQKQLLNLAAVLALRPPLILLDEPTAQLDPASKRQFAFMLARVQRELGITVLMATHAPEEMADFVTQTLQLSDIGFEAPVPARRESAVLEKADVAIEARDLFVKHGIDDPWVLKGLDLRVRTGTVHAVVGGNGSGKTTLLRTIAGDLKPRRGKVKNRLATAQAYLPQDPKAVFVCETVAEELREWQKRVGYTEDDVQAVMSRFKLEGMDSRHPYDLSGGQRQNLAFAKMMLCKPKLMLLDEPTKGLDARACATIVRTLRELADAGVTIVVSTHDLDMAAVCADEATLVFDGQAVCTQPVPQFFQDNLIWRPNERSRLYGELAGGGVWANADSAPPGGGVWADADSAAPAGSKEPS